MSSKKNVVKQELENEIIEIIQNQPLISSKEIFDGLKNATSYASLKRALSKLKSNELISTEGNGKSTKYSVSPTYKLLKPIELEQYYSKEIDERSILESFNFDLISTVLNKHNVFTAEDLTKLNKLHEIYQNNISQLSENEYKKELERLAIDLSWKSSQIEGNTYSLLETERLLREKETATGKTKDEAIMLLNHKDALDFIVEHTDFMDTLTVAKIEAIHSLLVKELDIDKNLRRRRVGISGTNYKPLENEFQIKDALNAMCDLINQKENIFEKALLALVLISYIQPFMDGNKRTARIVSNAILINFNYCPLSFRTVDSIEYKKAMLLFYEQNNIYSFKEIFIQQYEFAVKTYF